MATSEQEMSSYVAVYSNIPELTKCLETILPNIPFQEVSPGSGDDDMRILKQAEIIVADNNLLGMQLYNLPDAKWVQGTLAGVDALMQHYDGSKPKPPFIITRFSNYFFGSAMGEYVIANIVNHERKLMAVYENQRSSLWIRDGKISDHRTISDLTIGILGAGTIGREIAKVLKTLHACIWAMVRIAPSEDTRSPHIDDYRLNSDLPDLLQNCDYVINILPSTPDTTGLLNGDMLKHCAQKRSVFMNIGRSTVIKEEDLVNALNKGWLSAAILDVFETEPLCPSSALWTLPQVKITPHISGMSRPQNIAAFFKENLHKFQSNQPLESVLDLDKGY